jgi:uncharacterized protein (DUF2141 family)
MEPIMHNLRFASILALSLLASLAKAADLTIDVADIASAKGKVLAAVYAKKEDYLSKPTGTAMVIASPGKVSAVIKNLKPGDYAVTVFHDENDNGKLDANLMGIPTEPYGFGNDAVGNYGPPSFEQAVVHVADAGSRVVVHLR